MLSAPMQSAHLPQHSPLRSRSVLPSLFRLAAASRKADGFEFNPRSANGSSDSLRNGNTRSGRNGHSVCKPDGSARNTRTRCRRIHETLPKGQG